MRQKEEEADLAKLVNDAVDCNDSQELNNCLIICDSLVMSNYTKASVK